MCGKRFHNSLIILSSSSTSASLQPSQNSVHSESRAQKMSAMGVSACRSAIDDSKRHELPASPSNGASLAAPHVSRVAHCADGTAASRWNARVHHEPLRQMTRVWSGTDRAAILDTGAPSDAVSHVSASS